MVHWQIFLIAGVVSLILEMIVPSMFFLNFAISGVLTAIISLWVTDITVLVIDFAVIALLSIILLRPFLLKTLKSSKEKETGVKSEYIDQIAKVVQPVNKFAGVITVYDERWEARVENDDEIPEGTEVRIIKNDSLIMYVERV
ncbi:NfeD family protein [Spirochaetes bacterium]|uniref:NfeD family protein n=1 Tax=Candidatus Scatousia excrementipullorum TaxID=2840936 RepID=A0A9D9DPK1_9BACT|nr:NfeD family protein [Candidatus Scatousia excrementipullorum]